MDASPLKSFPFFLLRTPSLSINELNAVRAEYDRSRQVVTEALADEQMFREAIFLSSNNLYSTIFERNSPPDILRASAPLARYLFRMATRATPYGLFAGISFGSIGDKVQLDVSPSSVADTFCRIDAYILDALRLKLSKDLEFVILALRSGGVFRLNSTAWLSPDGFRYIESSLVRDDDHHAYKLARIEDSSAVGVVFDLLSEHPLSGEELVRESAARLDVTAPEAEQFLFDLAEAEFILCPPHISPTDPNPSLNYLDQLREIAPESLPTNAVQEAVDALAAVGRGLSRIDGFRNAASAINAVVDEPDVGRIIQVDMLKRGTQLELPESFTREVGAEIWACRGLVGFQKRGGTLSAFARNFEAVYGSSFVPLLEVMDPDHGILPFEGPPNSSLIQPVPSNAESEELSLSPIELLLLRKANLLEREDDEIVVDRSELAALSSEAGMPDSISVLGALLADSYEAFRAGKYVFELSGTMFSPASGLFGRFCCGEPRLERGLRQVMENSDSGDDETLHAEIVHLPNGRVGNVILRPVLSRYEIVHMGAPSVGQDEVIEARDLHVTVDRGEVRLFSKRLKRWISPRLSSAHNFASSVNLPVYRFLCALQSHNRPACRPIWGALAGRLPFLPGVRFGRLRLCRPTWMLTDVEVGQIARADPDSDSAAFAPLLKKGRVGNTIRIVQHDNFLELDLSHRLDRSILVAEAARRKSLTIEAVPKGNRELVKDGAGGSLRHEISLGFLQESSRRKLPAACESGSAFLPGSTWLYAKVYGSPFFLDRVVTDVYLPLAEMWCQHRAKSPYFLRYDEGGEHVRIRIKAVSVENLSEVRCSFEDLLQNCAERHGRLSRFEYATYHPEWRRYGGVKGVEVSERIFAADSLAVSSGLKLILSAFGDKDERWLFGLRSVYSLLKSFELDAMQQVSLLSYMVAGYSSEFQIAKTERGHLNGLYRTNRAAIQGIVEGADAECETLAEILNDRHAMLLPLVGELKAVVSDGELMDIFASFIHMNGNRIFSENARYQEMAILFLLEKALRSSQGRQRFFAQSI